MSGSNTPIKETRLRSAESLPATEDSTRTWRLGLRVAGAALLVASAAIHLDLYVTGYRTIPTIGALFLLQLITAFALGVAVFVTGSRLVAAAGAGLAISTLAGYLVSLRVSLFGFREVRTTAGVVAGIVEVCAFAVLAALALVPRPSSRSAERRGLDTLASGRYARAAWRTTGVVTILAAVLLAVSVSGGDPVASTTPSGHALLDVTTIGGTSVVTNAQGFTLYWFAPDTPSHSACVATCAAYWPPVTGTPTAGAGVTGTLGTIRRADGSAQATYDGHPLYTYIGDSSAGQASGNNLTLNGGVWHEMSETG
jgi:predicted lipoprotein with Yx(FWY)xxD motif